MDRLHSEKVIAIVLIVPQKIDQTQLYKTCLDSITVYKNKKCIFLYLHGFVKNEKENYKKQDSVYL